MILRNLDPDVESSRSGNQNWPAPCLYMVQMPALFQMATLARVGYNNHFEISTSHSFRRINGNWSRGTWQEKRRAELKADHKSISG